MTQAVGDRAAFFPKRQRARRSAVPNLITGRNAYEGRRTAPFRSCACAGRGCGGAGGPVGDVRRTARPFRSGNVPAGVRDGARNARRAERAGRNLPFPERTHAGTFPLNGARFACGGVRTGGRNGTQPCGDGTETARDDAGQPLSAHAAASAGKVRARLKAAFEKKAGFRRGSAAAFRYGRSRRRASFRSG